MVATSPATPSVASPIGAAGLVLLGLALQEVGASIAVLLFPQTGAAGMVTLRLVLSAAVLLVVCRPRWRGHHRGAWLTVVGFGAALAAMNLLFYEALERLPLGAAVTIEVVGPLILSVVVGRRASGWVWAILAFGGVVLLGRGGLTELDPVGVAFAAGAGAMWAAYILLSARTSRAFARLDGLAIAMSVGAVLVVPFGIASAGAVLLQPSVLGLGLAVALLSSTVPYALELRALRSLPAAAFSILMSLAPAIAATAGFLILGQRLGVLQLVAIGLVVIASAGAVMSSRRPLPLSEPTAAAS
jgi:inner membrane transporter RhtA